MTSPFAKSRYEHESAHLYFLPATLVGQLESSTSTYLIGSRGSGKTTLLKALHWEERQQNKTLAEQLQNDPFRGAFIGTYVKLPKMHVRSIGRWLEANEIEDDDYCDIFGFYIDLISTELIASAFATLLSKKIFDIDVSEERTTVASWYEQHSDMFLWAEDRSPSSIRDCQYLIKRFRRKIEKYARARAPATGLFDQLEIPELGELSQSFCEGVASLCDRTVPRPNEQWHFKVCMDEGECLSDRQQRTLNTLVRIVEWPVSYVVSYVGRPDDMTTTVFEKLSHQKVDRHVIVLDSLSARDFRELCDGVASVRVESSFKAAMVLGPLNLNGLLYPLIRRSEGAAAKAIEHEAEQFVASNPSYANRTSASLPYIEAHLSSRLGLHPPDPSVVNARRIQDSREYRKKFVAAYLSVCREIKRKKIPYASAPMVLGISDRCIRDFLSQMDLIFQEAGRPLPDFLSGEIPANTQSRAIRRASREKTRSIPDSGVLQPVQIGRLVRGLAIVTASIQQADPSDAHLRSSERGVFVLTSASSETARSELMSLVYDAADAGFLRVLRNDRGIEGFRVHCSLAPAYGFSYRGAYYPVLIRAVELKSLVDCESEDDLEQAALAVSRRIQKTSESDSQLSLFPQDELVYWEPDDVL